MQTLTGWAGGPGVVAALALLFKVTLLFAGAGIAAALLNRRSAAARHFVWLLALVGSLGLAVLVATPKPMTVAVPLVPATWQAPSATSPQALATGERANAPRPTALAGRAPAAPSEARPAMPRAAFRRWLPDRAGVLLLRLWLAGAAFVLGWFALGHVVLALLSRSTRPVGDPRWLALLERLSAECGVRRPVALEWSDAVATPMVGGLLRPKIVLPLEAERWPQERRRAVLLHELAHVVRRDPYSLLAASLACAAYWFHPGVWLARRRLRAESERACDDRVLAAGMTAPDYADHLLSVARSARSLALAGSVAIAMARRSTLEGRLLSLLDERVGRAALTRRGRAMGIAALTLALVALGLTRPVARAGAEAGASSPAAGTLMLGEPGSEASALGKPAATEPAVASGPALATSEAEGSDSEPVLASSTKRDEPDEGNYSSETRAEPGERLSIRLDAGGRLAIRGWDERRVEVRGTLAGPDWRRVRVEFGREDGGVYLRDEMSPRRGSFSTSNEYEIRVPRRFDVHVELAGGDVEILDLEGRFEGESGGGDIVLRNDRGHAELTTGGGDVLVTDCVLSGHVRTGGGKVNLERVRGGLRGWSGSSAADEDDEANADAESGTSTTTTIRRGSSASGGSSSGGSRSEARAESRVGRSESRSASRGVTRIRGGNFSLSKDGGEIVLDELPDGAALSTGGGDISIGRTGGDLSASTGGGSIEIGPAEASVVATTGAGDVHVVIALGTRAKNVTITSGLGKVVVELPPGLEADFDLETAYTRGHSQTQIRSDVPLEVDATSEWDGREGTPRKYVRAHAPQARAGRVRVHVKTVNGDIEIHQDRR